jgi:hypothetical protein
MHTEGELASIDLHETNLVQFDLSKVNLRRANLRRADLSAANLRGADLWGAMGLTDEQRADYRSRDALVGPTPSTPLSRSTDSPPASSTPQRDGEQGQSPPTPAQVAETPPSAGDTTLPRQEEDGADANSSGAAPPTQPDSPS